MPYTDSDPAETSLTLRGVWIHDPTDPEETVVQFLYGRAGRVTNLDAVQAGTRYEGRTYPVIDYSATFEEYSADFTISVPFGDDHAQQLADLEAFVRLRAAVCVRDNRGRRLFATLVGYSCRDEMWGSAVTITAQSVDYDESVL